ncbi:ABC transporter permease [Paenibacillus medicaginis]|uniref:ABC transporter permease n=1 Tax=Paenibacillus medicaginis TaxID=1470560 RepID=A0ABV5C8J1_9BACL
MYAIKLYIRSMIVQIKGNQQYRFNYFLTIFTVIFHYSVQLIAIWITLNHYENIRGWDIYEVSFIYMFFILSYGIMITFFAGFRDFSGMIHNGEFDVILVRPHNPMLQVMSGRLELTSIAQTVSGIILFFWCDHYLNISWSAYKIFLLIQGLIGAAFIQAGLLLLWSSLSFRLINTSALTRFGWILNANYLTYPLGVFNKTTRFLFTLFPLAFISYYPANAILEKDNFALSLLGNISGVIGVIFFLLIYLFWEHSIRYYKSSGN